MKKSLRVKLFAIITIFALIIVGISWLINIKYLERFYIKSKEESLVKYGQEIKEIFDNDSDDIDTELKLEKIEKSLNGDIMIFSPQGNLKYNSSTRKQMNRILGEGMEKFPFTKEDHNDLVNGKTIIKKYVHPNLGIEFLTLGLVLPNKDFLMIDISIADINESVNIANDFYVYIVIASLLIGTLVAFLISKWFTKPIIKLNNVAKSMSDLNFDKKYEVKTNDEIGELGKSINYLSEKLSITISDLNEANEKLKEDIERERKIDTMRKEFISNVSHELKTPIALVQGYTEGLKDNIASDIEDRNFYCDVIIEEAEKMNKLVKDLLNLSQIESGYISLDIEEFDLIDTVETVVNKYRPILSEKKISLCINKEVNNAMVNGDRPKIEQVLVNFINNAINHVDSKKLLSINISSHKDRDRVKVGIFNTGNNIEKDEIEKIWQSFYKIDKARSRKYGGTGLGLSIVKGILDLHNSNYGVINKGNGVEFWFDMKYI
ncbi:HAMP domain-containing sensor histidine kinase [Romboutsia sp.]|uniref:sensor histidine kinase n=1 Tax=Romboutsia sp. TaxID=1965302 RepID=UPI002B75FFB4|nr:HAMP domain-containing sensor histidine kinase [Romboutsia sp.]HSQ89429.1 HAMP domain-containing sensor histidine kinase [Romboutsia sp.]